MPWPNDRTSGIPIGHENSTSLMSPPITLRNGSEQKQKAQEEQNRPKIVQPSLPTIQEEKHPSEEKHDSSSQSRNYPWRESLTPASIPDWCLVIVGALAGLIALRSLKVISRQADEMEDQAILMKDQLAEMRRQTDWLIEKERPRLDIELDLFDPRQQTGGEYCITGCISFYGLTIARDAKAEILVSTERDVVEDAFEYYREDVAIADFHKTPQRIEIPRIIRPNSHDIPFSTTVYSSFGKAASFDEISTVLNRYKPRKRMEGSTISPATGLRASPIPKIMNNFASSAESELSIRLRRRLGSRKYEQNCGSSLITRGFGGQSARNNP